jgi:hypothetical protein
MPNRQSIPVATARFSFTHELERFGHRIEVECGYNVSRRYVPAQTYGPPENCYPAEGGEVELIYVTRNGLPFATTQAEDDELLEAAWIMLGESETDDDDYPDYRDEEDF